MKVIITLGGTQEPIDTVRKITNSSSGKFGIEIAKEMVLAQKPKFISPVQKDEGLELTLIAGKSAWQAAEQFQKDYLSRVKDIRLALIESTSDLETALKVELLGQPDIVIHSMAVSDYSVDFCSDGETQVSGDGTIYDAAQTGKLDAGGKMSSSMEHLVVVLKKNPKIIKMIKELAPRTFLVGFKLLDSVSEEKLFDVAFDLLRRNRCNLVFANDISNIRSGSHDGLLVYPEKSFDRVISGDSGPTTKARSAKALVDAIMRRAFVGHPKSVCLGELCPKCYEKAFNELHDTGAALNKKGYLPRVFNYDSRKEGTYGNLSVRIENGDDFAITGRNVNKASLGFREFCRIVRVTEKDPALNQGVYAQVEYEGYLKPSIDTAIHARIYRARPEIRAIMHVHTQHLILMPEKMNMTGYNYPCGSKEEADAILDALGATNTIVQMRNHGLLICSSVGLQDCLRQLDECMRAPYIDYGDRTGDRYAPFQAHLRDIDFGRNLPTPAFPIMIETETGPEQIGVLGEERIYGSEAAVFLHSPCVRQFYAYIDPEKRGHKIISKYLGLMEPGKEEPMDLITLSACNITGFYEKLGFRCQELDAEYIHMLKD